MEMDNITLEHGIRPTTPSLLPESERAGVIARDAASFDSDVPVDYVLSTATEIWHYSPKDALEVATAYVRLEIQREESKLKRLKVYAFLVSALEAIGWALVGAVVCKVLL